MSRTVRSIEEYNNVMNLLKNKSMIEVSRLTGIPWGTIKNWKNGRSKCYQESSGGLSDWKKNTLTQKIRDSSISAFQAILDKSASISAVLRHYDIEYSKPYYVDLVKEKINSGIYNLEKYDSNSLNNSQYGQWSVEEMFTENSNICRSNIRHKILRLNLIEYKCSECPIIDEHNGKKISLQLDHINGIRNDHRLKNLRWLCPNCHSQQDTSFGRNKK